MRLEIEVYGDVQLNRELLRFADRAQDMRPAFEDIANDFLEIGRKQFSSEGGYASGGWQPLSPDYLARKVRQGHDPRILHRTLRLRRSLTMETADTIRRITANELIVGSKVPYGRYHQHGGGNLPQRRPVELTEADRKSFMKTLQRHLIGGR